MDSLKFIETMSVADFKTKMEVETESSYGEMFLCVWL